MTNQADTKYKFYSDPFSFSGFKISPGETGPCLIYQIKKCTM